jgi:VCBS repeat-containing protein
MAPRILNGTSLADRIIASHLAPGQFARSALGDGNDVFEGSAGGDRVFGEAGNDVLFGRLGDDRLDGGEGNDTLDGGEGRDSLDGGLGDDSLEGGADDDVLSGGAGNNRLRAGSGDDRVTAGDDADMIWGDDGNDTILAGGGNNWAYGGGGDDRMSAGDGSDMLYGEAGSDTINAGEGNNWVYGGEGDDRLNAGDGSDMLYGDAGRDVINAGGGNNWVYGGADDDRVTAGDGSDNLFGDAGHDTLIAGHGNNRVEGGEGNDSLSAGTGHDVLDGGAGDDVITDLGGQNAVSGGAGSDRITLGDGDDQVSGDGGDDTIHAGGGRNTVSGGQGRDVLSSGAGADQLDGGEGHDILNAGAGQDIVLGGAGNDLIIQGLRDGTPAQDILRGGAGTDTLRLDFTRAEWFDAANQVELARLVAANATPAAQSGAVIASTPFGLNFAEIETLAVTVDGTALTAADDAVTARNDTFDLTEGGSVTANVTANDVVPDLIANVALAGAAPSPGSFSFNAQGLMSFDTGTSFEHLRAGQVATLRFEYRVTDADGDTDTARVVLRVTGTNDAASIAGTSTGTVTEDGTLTTGGRLSVSDVDRGEAVFATPASLAGTYGSFTFNATTGDWGYTLNNAAANVQALAAGQTVQDVLTVTSLDGTASQAITVNISGASDSFLQRGVTVFGSVDANTYANEANPLRVDYWYLNAAAGDRIILDGDRREGNMDMVLWVFSGERTAADFGGSLDSSDPGFIGFWDDSTSPAIPGPFGDPYADFIAPLAGVYTAIVTNFAPRDGGPDGLFDYSLLWVPYLAEPPPVPPAPLP